MENQVGFVSAVFFRKLNFFRLLLMGTTKKLSQSLEDYLEMVHMLHLSKGIARLKDIASELGVKAPSAVRAMHELKLLGYVEQEPYGGVNLTKTGLAVAKSVFGRHTLLKSFLLQLGVSPKNANADACSIEHVLSSETLDRIESFVSKNAPGKERK